MVFSKNGRLTKDKFRFSNMGGEEMGYFSHHKYLGVDVSSTGKFSLAEKT